MYLKKTLFQEITLISARNGITHFNYLIFFNFAFLISKQCYIDIRKYLICLNIWIINFQHVSLGNTRQGPHFLFCLSFAGQLVSLEQLILRKHKNNFFNNNWLSESSNNNHDITNSSVFCQISITVLNFHTIQNSVFSPLLCKVVATFTGIMSWWLIFYTLEHKKLFSQQKTILLFLFTQSKI